MLDINESFNILKKYKFNIVKFKNCKSLTEISSAFDRFNKPVVLKVVSKKHSHKTDVKGVVLNINDLITLRKEFNRLRRLGESVIIQEQVKGLELIIGINYDNDFGPVIMFGLGGIFVEIFKDVSFRSCPITNKDAISMINELKSKKLLKEYRGKEGINLDLLKKLLVDISNFAVKENIKEMDLNPIIFTEKKYFIVDARIEKIER